MEGSFLIEPSERHDIKRNSDVASPRKHYFVDSFLRNARRNFRQNEGNHIMANVFYNELRMRGQQVGVGIVPAFGKSKNGLILKKRLEGDSFAKIIVAKDLATPHYNENGIADSQRLRFPFGRRLDALTSEADAYPYIRIGGMLTARKRRKASSFADFLPIFFFFALPLIRIYRTKGPLSWNDKRI